MSTATVGISSTVVPIFALKSRTYSDIGMLRTHMRVGVCDRLSNHHLGAGDWWNLERHDLSPEER